MNQYQMRLVRDFIYERITPDVFLKEFGIQGAREKVSLKVLEDAFSEKNAADVEYGLSIGYRLGITPEYKDILRLLFVAEWHHSHEDIISVLDDLRDPELVDVFYSATQVVPAYLAFDEARALAVKAIWALGNIGTDEARKKLSEISTSPVSRLKVEALKQLER